MPNRLEVPEHFPQRRVDRHDRIRVFIATFSFASEIVDAGGARCYENDFPNRIRGKDRPRICRAGAVGVGPDPCLRSRIRTALRNGVERPTQRPRSRIVRAYFSARCIDAIVVGDRGPDDDDTCHNCWRRGLLILRCEGRRISQPLTQPHGSGCSKTRARRSSRSVERDQPRIDGRKEDAKRAS